MAGCRGHIGGVGVVSTPQRCSLCYGQVKRLGPLVSGVGDCLGIRLLV